MTTRKFEITMVKGDPKIRHPDLVMHVIRAKTPEEAQTRALAAQPSRKIHHVREIPAE